MWASLCWCTVTPHHDLLLVPISAMWTVLQPLVSVQLLLGSRGHTRKYTEDSARRLVNAAGTQLTSSSREKL